jgi:hypothetical protein
MPTPAAKAGYGSTIAAQSKAYFLPCHKGSGAPSFAFFAKGGMPLLLARGPSPQLLLIPPFAESAKDGAPDPLWQGKRYSPLPFDLSLVFITLGEPHAHGDTAEVVP